MPSSGDIRARLPLGTPVDNDLEYSTEAMDGIVQPCDFLGVIDHGGLYVLPLRGVFGQFANCPQGVGVAACGAGREG